MIGSADGPWIIWIVVGVTVLSLPLIWKSRLRGSSHGWIGLMATIWVLRIAAGLLLIASLVLVLRGLSYPLDLAQLLVGCAAVGLVFADPIARLLIGPVEMRIEDSRVRRYRGASRSIGIIFVMYGIVVRFW